MALYSFLLLVIDQEVKIVIRGTTSHYVSLEFHNWLVLAGFRQARQGLSGINSAKNGRQE